MSEELINVLTKVPGLTVPSRTSSFAYKGRNTDLRQIGKDLRVGTILEGSVRSAGTTIRITAQLIDANSDRHLWSETYDRKFTDIFKLQDELATAIATAFADLVSDHVIYVLQTVGQLRKAEAQAAEAYRLAPADRAALIIMAALKSLMGVDADAIRFADLAVKMGYDPTIVPIPQVYANGAVRSGHYAEAAEHTVSSLPPTMRDAGGAEVIKLVFGALADPSKKSRARQALRDFVHKTQIRGTGVVARADFIVDFVRLGALDDAYELASRTLDDLARSGTVGGWPVLWMPEMRPFRQDPRFQKFAARLKLFDYWEQYGPPDGCDLKDGKLICH